MNRLPINHRRLYGYMCVLILLQEFHVVIRADINKVYNDVQDLSQKFQRQQSGLKSKANKYAKSCSEDLTKDTEILGRKNSPQGLITSLMFAVVFTLANCVPTARKVLQNIIDQVGEESLMEVVTMVADVADEIEKTGNIGSAFSKDLKGIDKTIAEQEDVFLSGLLAENLLNAAEMMKLFDTVAKGDSFDNTTEVMHLASEIGELEIEEIKEQSKDIWLTASKQTDMVATSVINASKGLGFDTEARRAHYLMREITVSFQLDSATNLFMIYERDSHKVLSVRGHEFYLSDYDSNSLTQQLWVLKNGKVFNVGSRLAITMPDAGNVSSEVTKSRYVLALTAEPAVKANTWRLFGQYLVSNFDSRCALQFHYTLENIPTLLSNVTLDCDVDIVNVKASVIFFQHANTSDNFIKNIEQQPVSYIKSQFARFTRSKFMIFMKLLKYIIKPSRHEHENQNTFLEPQRLRLQSTFFIKSTIKPCKVLMGEEIGEHLRISFEDFAEDSVVFQLWYWKEGQLINVGTQLPLEINAVLNDQNQITHTTSYLRLWTLKEQKLLGNDSCQLVLDESSPELVLNCKSKSLLGQWEFVTFDKPHFNNFLKLVCLFFIQSALWPNEYLTAFKNVPKLLTSPLIAEDIYSQLWYQSKGRLINAWTGNGITLVSETKLLKSANLSTTLTKWHVNSDTIALSKSPSLIFTLDTSRNGTITIDENQGNQFQKWKTTIFDSESSTINGSFACSDIFLETLPSFAIRNSALEPCRLLTTMEGSDGSFSLQMKLFDADYADHYKWYDYHGTLINAATCLAIQPITKTSGSVQTLVPTKLHAFQQNQKWKLASSQLLHWDLNADCIMDYVKDRVVMNCDKIRSFAPKWNFTSLPLNKNELSVTWTSFMCFYFLRITNEPCQYITADPKHGGVHLRPMTEDLLTQQLWYWNERTLALATTGQLMGIPSINLTSPWIQLINTGENKTLTSWHLSKDKLILRAKQSSLAIDYNNDGKLLLANPRNDQSIQMSFVDYNSLSINTKNRRCSIPVDGRLELFFIRSYLYDCFVLTGAKVGEQPSFEYFDQDEIESQLWFISNDHIINFKSHLVLHLDIDTWISGSHVVMKNYYTYANNQIWTLSGEMIFYDNSEECVLDVDKEDSTLIVSCRPHGGMNQKWERIAFDDHSEYLETITCLFFIRHEVVPCEMLTYTEVPDARLRPVTAEFIAKQLWYWSKSSIMNAKSGLALDISDTGNVFLGNKDKTRISQQWFKHKMYIMSETDHGRVLGLDKRTGTLKLLNKHFSDNTDASKWSFIDMEDGSDDPSLLQCETISNKTMYIIRSDKDPCHILSEEKEGEITLQKAGRDNAKQVWVNVRRHIINVLSGKALSINRFTNLEPVRGIYRYEHEIKQHWKKVDTAVLIGQTNNVKALDACDGVTVYRQDGTDDQKWTWLNLKDVQNDAKLLRCSFCYDKGEESANEVMSYFPILGWAYSLTRAAVYAGKGCDDVALESLQDFGIGAALDIGVGIVTVLTMGTASAAALGVKTAVQGGVRAGLKISLKALSSSIQSAVRQSLNAGKMVLKQGIKKSMIQFTKTKVSNIKYALKSDIKTIKQIPIKTKKLFIKTSTSIKNMPSKVYNSARTTSYGTFKSSLSGHLKQLPMTLKTKLNKIGNKLAERAENKIKQLEDIKKSKPSTHVRCKRSPSSNCITPKKTNNARKKNSIEQSVYIQNPDTDIKESFEKLLDVAKKNADVKGLQNAHFGLSTRKLHSGVEYKFDKNTVRSKVLRDVDEFPYDKNFNRIEKTYKGDRKPQSHTEQALLEDIDKAIKINCAGKNCELYMWTKNSPCMINTYSFREQNMDNIIPAKSCFSMLLELCHKHVKFTPGFTRCHIGFSDYYFSSDRINPEKRFMSELQGLTETTKSLASKSSRYPTLTKESLENIGKFIRFYRIPV